MCAWYWCDLTSMPTNHVCEVMYYSMAICVIPLSQDKKQGKMMLMH